MLLFKSNLIKKGYVYSCNVDRTMNESEFIEKTGVTEEEMTEFKHKLNTIYSSGRYKCISEHLCIHIASVISYIGNEVQVCFYNLLTTGRDNFHYAVSDYCKPMIPRVNAFGIDYKDISYSTFNSLYIVNRTDIVPLNNFYVHFIGNEIVVKGGATGGDIISIDLINKDITVLNSDYKPTTSEQTYLNMLCQIYCQDKKFMLDVLEDKFVLITA